MLKENNKIIKYDHTEKFMKTQFLIHADMDCFPERINTCHNNPKKPATTKITKH